jgi:type IV pilus assembly protein PilA
MARALHSPPFVASRHRRGFTLIELMIVVVIVGILAMLAVVGYRKLVQSSHVSEATGMIQNIRVAQEAYHSETQQYANISNSPTAWYPAAPVYSVMTAWGLACSNCTAVNWTMLPLHVDGPVVFGYATTAGPANTAITPPSVTVDGSTVTFQVPTTDWYFVAAEADLDGVAGTTTDVYGTSLSNQLLVSNEGQ